MKKEENKTANVNIDWIDEMSRKASIIKKSVAEIKTVDRRLNEFDFLVRQNDKYGGYQTNKDLYEFLYNALPRTIRNDCLRRLICNGTAKSYFSPLEKHYIGAMSNHNCFYFRMGTILNDKSNRDIHFKRLNLDVNIILLTHSRKTKSYKLDRANIFKYMRALIESEKFGSKANIKYNLPTQREIKQMATIKDRYESL